MQTAATVSVAVMAAAKFPEKQKAAQAEIDRVVGRNRSASTAPPGAGRLPTRSAVPSFDDMPELPYLTAFANEVFRWRPISSGIAHATTEELQYVRRAR
jgi:cytochrome P450